MRYRFDLHIHSCLSPCGDLASSPTAIVAKAKAAGLNGIMLADHNTSRNSPALAEACHRQGLPCRFGMEITTAEELHALAVFDTLDAAAAMTDLIYAALPKRVNQPEVFGDQPIVNADDEIEEIEWRLLSAPCRLGVRDIGQSVHALGGLFIASHVDRPTFSVFSQLGAIAGDEGFDAVELTRFANRADWAPKLHGLPILRSSDAHYLHDIGNAYTEADMPDFTVTSLRTALQSRKG